jgi:1-acyl-sn-glycerol-3-phosphate acyltransferase
MRFPRYRRWIWWALWLLVAPLRPLVCRLRVPGLGHVPRQGGAVVACNHTMGPDYVLLALASPRELMFMG